MHQRITHNTQYLYTKFLSFPVLSFGVVHTGVDKGGPGPPMAGQKKKGRGYFYQMSNMYTCIAYLTEIRKFCSKNLVHKSVNFEAQNAVKLIYEHP